MMRIGHGYDVHAFCSGDAIMLGAVAIPHTKAFQAHSDGDVLIHALCDALLGALALGDIGHHYPDTDARFKNADSTFFLKDVYRMIMEQGFSLGNADITIIAQAPRMSPHINAMREQLSRVLSCDISRLNIKATTTEKLGFAGREEGIAVHAVVLLEQQT
ncbi:MAG: 2-C-methyl-D-erythritol 2,4-cyclodiphosphate synthase [Gammaproteobacteria bacterium]|nr:2-C-methyl-D-erythritol 2,4-cyclodiphosphate synthase [Gammaproteobacteria bacterium]MBL7000680.1 2-C-methyl-D-erythritol 2,4-cyclodiphosphate synthase [Gammaproteobacteria bacterium]